MQYSSLSSLKVGIELFPVPVPLPLSRQINKHNNMSPSDSASREQQRTVASTSSFDERRITWSLVGGDDHQILIEVASSSQLAPARRFA